MAEVPIREPLLAARFLHRHFPYLGRCHVPPAVYIPKSDYLRNGVVSSEPRISVGYFLIDE